MKRLLSLLTVFCLCLALIAPSQSNAAILRLSKAKATMEVDSILKLKLGSINASKISWKSSNTKVASVSKTGTITAKKEGSVKISASINSKKYTCAVTVVDSNKTVSKKDYYSLGEAWTFDGQWKVTFDSVTTSDYRNLSVDTNPEQVIVLNYTIEKLGYEGNINNLIKSSISTEVIDEEREAGTQYPWNIAESPDTTPNDVSIEEAYGLYNESKTVTVYVIYREGFDQEKAKFILKID